MEGKKSLSTFVVLCIMLMMICIVTISNTYAKYTTSLTGSDSATVASWNWKINDVSIEAKTTTYTLDLFKTINDTNGATEADVKSGKIIAPGTQGSFDIKIDNQSEVNAKYAVKFTVTGADGMNLQFSPDGTNYTDSLSNIAETAINMGDSTTVKIFWKWAYEVDDETNKADTALGFTGSATPTVTAELTLVQAD